MTGLFHVLEKAKIGNSIFFEHNPLDLRNEIYTDLTANSRLYIQSNQTQNNFTSTNTFNTIINSGNEDKVGIGTDSPQKKLQITTTHLVSVLPPPDFPPSPLSHEGFRLENIFRQSSNSSIVLGTNTWDIEPSGSNNLTFLEPGQPPVLTLLDFGRAIIGPVVAVNANTYDAPSRLKLDVRGDGRFTDATGNNYLRVGFNSANAILDNFGQGALLINFYSDKDVVIGSTNATLKIVGNTGMGTNPDPNYKVKVNVFNALDKAFAVFNGTDENFLVHGDGFCFARRFEVATGTFAHPDYVFEKGYPLLSISDLKSFLETNRHHPNFFSAAEYAKKGKYDLLEMDMNLLKTSEELTLYVIRQDEQMTQMKKMIDEQSKMIEQMKIEIKDLQKKHP